MELIKIVSRRHHYFVLFFLLFMNLAPHQFAQSGVSSLNAEISRLEKLSLSGQRTERYGAFMDLALLHRLSGDPEAALKSCEAALSLFPGDSKALLEQGRLFVALGEYDRAASSAMALVRADQEVEVMMEGRYLNAQAEAFRSLNVQPLAVLADEKDFSGQRSAIYYTIWKLAENPSWRTRLVSEFPLSPEAKIAAGQVNPAVTPLWLLFPGRQGIALSPPPLDSVPANTPSAMNSSSRPQVMLQTGIFSNIDNARALVERLKKAGFEAEIFQRRINSADYWAVGVGTGNDVNAMIRKLKDSGFDSFPL